MSFRAKRRNLFGFLEVLPDQPVLSAAGAGQAVIQPKAALADPSDLPGRHAGHQGVIFHIFGHHGTGGNHGAASYRMTAHYRAIRAERCAFAHARTRVNSVHREVRPRSIYIREYAGRAAEDMVLYLDALVDGNIILDPDTIPYADVIRNVHVLTQGTVRPDDSPSLDMAEMPNFCTGADLDAVIHVTALVNEKVLHSPVSPLPIYPIIAEAKTPAMMVLNQADLQSVYFSSLMEVIMTQRLSSFML